MVHIFATDSGELVRSIPLEILESSGSDRERILRKQIRLDAEVVNARAEAAGSGGDSKMTGSPDASEEEDADMGERGQMNLHGRKFVNKYTNHVRASWNPSRAMLVISNDKRLEWWL